MDEVLRVLFFFFNDISDSGGEGIQSVYFLVVGFKRRARDKVTERKRDKQCIITPSWQRQVDIFSLNGSACLRGAFRPD